MDNVSPTPSTHYDIMVIGSGAGGKIARPAANLGYRVAYIEQGPIGGTCLNRGCIPSKMLIHAADIMSEYTEGDKFFITNSNSDDSGCDGGNRLLPCRIDRPALIQRVCDEIDTDAATAQRNVSQHPGVTLIKGHAVFVDSHTVEVNGVCVSADRIFIVAGCRANIPDYPGLADTPYLTYAEALRLQTTPKTMLVIGGGYIATELGYFYGQTGTRVEFLVRGQGMLTAEDHDVRVEFQRVFEKRFGVWYGVRIVHVGYDHGEFRIEAEVHGREGSGDRDVVVERRVFTAESLLVATGVRPNTDTLRVDLAGVRTDDRGFVVVDGGLRTSQAHVWAFGDITGGHLFRHTANYEGTWLFDHVCGGARGGRADSPDSAIVYPPVPHAVFSNPQIGAVGLTEREAVAAFGARAVVIGRGDYEDAAMGNAMRVDHGFCKLIFSVNAAIPVSPSHALLVGAHIIGREASTMIHMCIAYIKMRASLADMIDTIYIHPALPEVIRDAARDAKDNLKNVFKE